jgi:hypothetical protein
MQENQTWITVFRRIPANLHDTLALGLTTGTEIVVQKILKLEPDFMIIRGRLAGTQDAGRVVLIPYSQLAFVAVIRDLKETEIEAIFGQSAAPAVADLHAPDADQEPSSAAPTEVVPANDPTAAVEPKKKPEAVSKTILLAKLRERLKDMGPPGK